MNRVLHGLTWKTCLAYIDDVIVFSRTFDQHLNDVEQVLQCFIKANLKLKPEKCVVATHQVDYLGFKFTSAGMTITDSKVEAMLAFKPPRTAKQLYSFLASLIYYNQLAVDFGHISDRLYELCKSKGELKWSPEAQTKPNQGANLSLSRLQQAFRHRSRRIQLRNRRRTPTRTRWPLKASRLR
jgi:hypothetical protein